MNKAAENDVFYFENELKERIKKDIYADLLRKVKDSYKNAYEINLTLQFFLDMFWEFCKQKGMPDEKIKEVISDFESYFDAKNIQKVMKNTELSDEEFAFIGLSELSGIWREKYMFLESKDIATFDVLLRRKVISDFGEEALKTFGEILNQYGGYNPYEKAHYAQLFSECPFGKDTIEEYRKHFQDQVLNAFNMRINCGGYALRIDQCVFPRYQKDFGESVSYLLQVFPFIRLLGDKPLEDDEYLVLYKAPPGENVGHHFARIDSDGVIREKNGSSPVQEFKGWCDEWDGWPEAVFAVKKSHKMFDYSNEEIDRNDIRGLNFEETVEEAIRQKVHTFDYHCHTFKFKAINAEEVAVFSDDGKLIANVITDNGECVVEVKPQNVEYVENLGTNAYKKYIKRHQVDITGEKE